MFAAPMFSGHSTHADLRPISERIPTTKHKGDSPAGPAHIGDTVTIDTQPGSLKLTVDKLEFAAGRVMLGDTHSELPTESEKLLIVHYTLENPNASAVPVSGKTVRFTALDEFRKPHEDVPLTATEDGDSLDGPLAPGAKVDAIKVIHVPGHGPLAALLVDPGLADATPLHVEVTGQIAKLPAPYADPQDPTGYTVLPTIAAKMGDSYPVGDCDLTLEKAEYSDDSLLNYSGETPPDSEHVYAVFTFDVVCRNPSGESFGLESFNPELTTADGVQTDPANAPLLNGTLDLALDPELPFDDDRHFRVYFVISTHAAMGSLTVRSGEHGHSYVYDLSDVQKPPD